MVGYHAGEFELAINALERNIERGGPIGFGQRVYLAAAIAATGDQQGALAIYSSLGKDERLSAGPAVGAFRHARDAEMITARGRSVGPGWGSAITLSDRKLP